MSVPDGADQATLNFELMLRVVDCAERLLDTEIITPNPQAQTAFEELRRAVRTWQIAQADPVGDDVEVRAKRCDRCRCPIFFARTIRDKWMPMELATVDAETMIAAWRWVVVFDHVEDGAAVPYVIARPLKTSGEVWVCHIDTCGLGPGPRHRIPSLVHRWKANVQRANTDASGELVDRLAALAERLSEPQGPDADNEP